MPDICGLPQHSFSEDGGGGPLGFLSPSVYAQDNIGQTAPLFGYFTTS